MARINHNNIMMSSLRGVQKPLTSHMAFNEQWIATTTTWPRNDGNTFTPMSLRGGRKTDEAIHTSFMDCHAHIRSLAMTPQGRLLCLDFTPSCNYVNLLWINTNGVSYNLDIII
ncbi:hypothetical protein RiCNE_00170 [Rickettsia endosymbiont of Culicoides newsteadi]|nr:hypothetical protein RiCNE_00170 [Rickettsia endosymbiont of Culicoides newsteadi]